MIDPPRPPINGRLIQAACWAAFGALAAREGGAIGAAAAILVATGWTCFVGRAGPAVFALPAALAAFGLPEHDARWPGEGPVAIDGVVGGRFVRDPAIGELRFDLIAGGGQRIHCRAPLRRGGAVDEPLPGDRVRGRGFLHDPDERRDQAMPPLVGVELAALEIEHRTTFGGLATALRLRLERALRRALPGEAGSVAAHLVLGRGPRLPDDLVDAHRATGLAHLLAVSGAHATLLAWMLASAFAAARGRDPWQARGFRRLCAVLLFAYGAVTGFDPPVLRALVAWAVLAVAAAHGRRADLATALAAPALVTALITPRDLLSISFCLSYAAVLGLGAAGAFARVEGLVAWIAQALRASTWAMIATAPLTLAFFGQLAPWTILGTPLLAPIVALMLALGVVTAVLGDCWPTAAVVPAWPLAFLTDGYAAAVRSLAELPCAPIHATRAAPTAELVAAALCGIAALAWRRDRWGLLVTCVVAGLPHFVGPASALPSHLQLCDVGHGQAAVARLPDGQTLVVDCGTMVDPARAAIAVEDALVGARHIEVLVLSHADRDHSGGVPRLLRRVPIALAVLPDAMRDGPLARAIAARGTAIEYVARGGQFEALPGVLVVAPQVAADLPSNERSLWVRIDVADTRIVLPGDAGAASIRAAVADHRLAGPADLLVLPHHGRGTAASAAMLLDVLRPSVGMASSGDARPTPFGRGIVARGGTLLSTATQGSLTVLLDGSGRVRAARPVTTRAR